MSVSCGGTGQQWPAVGTGGLAAADLEGKLCGIVLLEEVAISPPPPQSHQADHLENNYTIEILALLLKL